MSSQEVKPMQNTHNTFVVPIDSSSVLTDIMGRKNAAKGQGDAENGEEFVASFLASLTQAIEQTDSDARLDLTFSAESSETYLEHEADLSVANMTDKRLFSKSVWGILASLKNDVDQKGVDLEAFTEEIDQALGKGWGKALSDLDMKSLEATLAKLQNRITHLENDPAHLNFKVAVSDNLLLGREPMPETYALEEETLSAGIFSSMSFSQIQEKTTESKEDESNEALQVLNLSRISSYLKPKASGEAMKTATTEVSKASSKSSQESTQEESVLFSRIFDAAEQGISGASSPSSGALADSEAEDAGKNGSRDAPKSPVSELEANVNEKDPAVSDKEADESQLRTSTQERKTNFNQFFEGILARRSQTDTQLDVERPNILEFAREMPFSGNGALREGVDNVVRFIRMSGEQKASLTVDPPALGRLTVELTSNAAGLEASIKVSSEQVRQLVQDELAQLRWSLAQQGVQLTHFSVDVQQDDRRQDPGQAGGRKRRTTGAGRDEEEGEDLTTFRVDLNEGLLYWIA
jgi:flagellar hook-length control protein FliK